MRARFRGAARRATTVLVLAMLASGCTAAGSTKAASPAPVLVPEQPVRGGTLVVGLDKDPGSLNPAVTTDEAVHTASEPMFNGLVGIGARGEVVPELAGSWTIDQGGALYRFSLRDGVTWHDGQPFSSADVKFTFERAILPLHARAHATLAAANPIIETPDAHTVVFRFPAPYAPLLRQLDVTEAPILPQHVYEACTDMSTVTGCPANRAPVGTGPFKFESYDANGIRMVRNPDYGHLRPDLPYLDSIVERFIPGQAARVAALAHKEIDWAWHLDGPDAETARGTEGVGIDEDRRGPGGGYCVLTLSFNMAPPPGRTPFLSDERVRQALWASTDRQAIVDTSLFGLGAVSYHPMHSAIVAARVLRPNLPVFDIGRARRLLDQAGWKDEGGTVRVARGIEGVPNGTPLVVDYHGFASAPAGLGQLLEQQWSQVGVRLIPVSADGGTVADLARSRQFDTAAGVVCDETDPFIGVRGQYYTGSINGALSTNVAGYSAAEMDRLWDQSTAEVDLEARYQTFQRIQDLAMRDLPYLWIAETSRVSAWTSACGGFSSLKTGLFAEAAYCKR